MGFEPIVNCRICDEPLDVYIEYEHRFCECCLEAQHEQHADTSALIE
jgi:hypothetical protein